jgi:phage terminase small subunit
MPRKKPVASKDIQTRSLDDRQEKFCREYLVDFNASRAAVVAGYSEKSAKEQGSRMLTSVNIVSRIKEIADELMKKNGDPAQRIIIELQEIAFGDMKDFMEWKDGKIEWKDSKTLGSKTKLVQEISESYSATGGSRKIKLHDKLKAFEMLMRYYGLFKDKVQHEGEVTAKVVITIPSNGRERS